MSEAERAVSVDVNAEEGARLMLPPRDGWLTMKEAAAKCRCSLFWFSRNWRSWGLRPSKVGRLLFDEKEVDAFLRSHRVRQRGRPRNVRGLHAEA